MCRTLFALLFICAVFVDGAAAQDLTPAQEASYKTILFEVLSPFCPGRSLNDCPSGAASELKDEIRGMVKDGQSQDEIVATLLQRYGDEIRAVPPLEGTGIPLWLGPAVFFALGAVVVLLWLRSNRAKE